VGELGRVCLGSSSQQQRVGSGSVTRKRRARAEKPTALTHLDSPQRMVRGATLTPPHAQSTDIARVFWPLSTHLRDLPIATRIDSASASITAVGVASSLASHTETVVNSHSAGWTWNGGAAVLRCCG